jgi:hypothetical protein
MNAATHTKASALHFMYTQLDKRFTVTKRTKCSQQAVDIDESPPGEVRRAYNCFVNFSITPHKRSFQGQHTPCNLVLQQIHIRPVAEVESCIIETHSLHPGRNNR